MVLLTQQDNVIIGQLLFPLLYRNEFFGPYVDHLAGRPSRLLDQGLGRGTRQLDRSTASNEKACHHQTR
jgi:hypothetical protein